MVPRFYAPHAAAAGPTLTLDEDESHHLGAVMRVGVGDLVHVFDGEGGQWRACVAALDRRRRAVLADLVALPPQPPPVVRLVLVAAMLKGEAMDAVVRDATVMGVEAIVPAWTDRSAVARRGEGAARLLGRWRRLAIAACKQCGRARLPRIEAPARFEELLTTVAAGVRLIATEPGAAASATDRVDDLGARARASGAALMVGPEGGWTPAEVARAGSAGWHPWSLGALVLRAESVPLAALAVLRYAWMAERR